MDEVEKSPTIEEYFAQLRKSRDRYISVIARQIEIAKRVGSEKRAFGHAWINSPAVGRHGYYEPGGRHSFEGLGGYTFKSLRTQIESFASEGRNTLVIDHMGNGRPGIELGAHYVLSTSRIANEDTDPRVVQILGDALSVEVAEEVTREARDFISKQKTPPFIIAYLRPIAGLGETFTNMYVFHRLYSELRELYAFMSDGDLINIDSIGTGHDLSLLKEILSDFDVDALLHTDKEKKVSPALIEKNSAVCASLPTEAEVLKRNPSLARRLIRLDALDVRNPFRQQIAEVFSKNNVG